MFSLIVLLIFTVASATDLPTLHEYYTSDGISSGLSVDQPYFTLNGKNITILSGTIHYFRIPPQYWRDRLRKLRAAGLNTVETYIPWNLHEPENGTFDFGNGGTEMKQFLDLQTYLKIAQEEDLFVIVRPGPYICAEWEWGGLPSWLLREKDIRIRTSDSVFMAYVKRYFDEVLPLLIDLQFTKGGPVIAFQVENEYGGSFIKDLDYIQELYDIMKNSGIVELLLTSDNALTFTTGTIPEILFQTVNFGTAPEIALDILKQMQPNKPFMVMEYWTGWFDYWSDNHKTVNSSTFRQIYETILSYPASVNMYMFCGGTNWGFLNGANIVLGDNSFFQPITTSYDYDAPLSEAGDYTEKYEVVKELVQKYNPTPVSTPEPPELIERVAYASVSIQEQLLFSEMIKQASVILEKQTTVPMEKLSINHNSGQSYGYIVYRQANIKIPANSVLTITGHVRDTVMVLIDGTLISKKLETSDDLNGFGYWRLANSNITLTSEDLENVTLDLVFENWGRSNYGNMYFQFKGLTEENMVYLNDEELTTWTIIPFDFKKSWTSGWDNWKTIDDTNLETGPGLYKGKLTIEDRLTDTFIDMQKWNKGVVIVNGFVLGKYASHIGPQQTLYLPGPFLQIGQNEIVIFEQFEAPKTISFVKDPIFDTP